jgi:branched-chain amino acid transport system substrate-binding protein
MKQYKVLLLVIVILLGACTDDSGEQDQPTAVPTATLTPVPTQAPTATPTVVDPTQVVIAPGGRLQIGIATDLSNLLPSPGLDIAQAASLAIDEFNERGGLLGFEIEALVEDDLCTAEGAQDVASRFVADPDVAAVIGHVCSGASIPASEIYQPARIPMVSPSSTAGAFTDRGLDVVNRVVFNDNAQGEVAARFIYEVLGAKQVAVLHNQTPYGEGIARTVALTFDELGGDLLAFEGIDLEAEDYTPLLTTLAEDDPDLIYLGGYDDEAARIAEQLKTLGMEDIIFFSGDGVYTQDFLDIAGEFAEGVYATFGTQEGDPGRNQAFDTTYENIYGVDPDELGPYHPLAYDAANVILMALEQVAKLDEAGNLVISREELIKAIRATSRYRGLSGLITCDENGDCGSATISVFQVKNGDWVEIDVPEELQTSR